MRCRALCAIIALGVITGCGPKMGGIHVHPPDAGLPPATGPRVEMRYLGNGGWRIQRDADVVVTAPFVSNPAGIAIYTPSKPHTDWIDARIPAMPEVKIMLIGHSHYDHAMDLPHILSHQAPDAKLYGSATVKYLLNETIGRDKDDQDRVIDVSKDAAQGLRRGAWIRPPGSHVRFMPLSSTHAPHVLGFIKVVSWSTLDSFVPKGELPTIPAAWPEGETLAFVIDFMRGQQVEFRVYYQDAAADPGKGIIPLLRPEDDVPVDVAILCVAAFTQVPGNPEGILGNTKPRYAIGGHWEDFIFMPSGNEEHRPVWAPDVGAFMKRAHAMTKGPVYILAPGETLFVPIQPR